jgi:hypothetical protein
MGFFSRDSDISSTCSVKIPNDNSRTRDFSRTTVPYRFSANVHANDHIRFRWLRTRAGPEFDEDVVDLNAFAKLNARILVRE